MYGPIISSWFTVHRQVIPWVDRPTVGLKWPSRARLDFQPSCTTRDDERELCLLAVLARSLTCRLSANLSIPAPCRFFHHRTASVHTPARSPFHLEAWCARYRAPAGAITTPPCQGKCKVTTTDVRRSSPPGELIALRGNRLHCNRACLVSFSLIAKNY